MNCAVISLHSEHEPAEAGPGRHHQHRPPTWLGDHLEYTGRGHDYLLILTTLLAACITWFSSSSGHFIWNISAISTVLIVIKLTWLCQSQTTNKEVIYALKCFMTVYRVFYLVPWKQMVITPEEIHFISPWQNTELWSNRKVSPSESDTVMERVDQMILQWSDSLEILH